MSCKHKNIGGVVGIRFFFFQKADIPVLKVFCILSHLNVFDIIDTSRTDRGSYRNKSAHRRGVSVSLVFNFVTAYI